MSLGTSFTLFQYISSAEELARALGRSSVGNIMGTPFGQWMKLICFQNGGLALEEIRDKYISDDEAIDRIVKKGVTLAEFTEKSTDERNSLISIAKWEIFEEELGKTQPGNEGSMMTTQNKKETAIELDFTPGKYVSRDLDFNLDNRAKVLRAAAEGQSIS